MHGHARVCACTHAHTHMVKDCIFSHQDIFVACLFVTLSPVSPTSSPTSTPTSPEILKIWTLPFLKSFVVCTTKFRLLCATSKTLLERTLNLASSTPHHVPCAHLQQACSISQVHPRLFLVPGLCACQFSPFLLLALTAPMSLPLEILPDSSRPNIGFFHCILMFIPLSGLLSHFYD